MSTTTQNPAEEPAKCPVDHTALKHLSYKSAVGAAPHPIPPSTPDGSQAPEKCPVDHTAYKHFLPATPPAPNAASANTSCDSETMLNPSNNMPQVSQNFPLPGQNVPLRTSRVVSSIPKADDSTEKLWVYPSEQMFFNAMRRKNWNPQERDMSIVVPIHNAVNEQAWRKILEWEGMHQT